MTILYIHGMGGGSDSRMPAILSDCFRHEPVRVVTRTYPFDPEEGARAVALWVEALRPDLLIGESQGALQAHRVRAIPHLFVSPALGAPRFLGAAAVLSLLPGMRALLNRIYKPREGDWQPLDFRFSILRKYPAHGRLALENCPRKGSADFFYAFFGRRDHYRRSGVVSLRRWRRLFGADTYFLYDGTHFMEENFVRDLLDPKIRSLAAGDWISR